MPTSQHSASDTTALPGAPAPSNFRLPGPTPVPPAVAAAGSWPMINHRGAEFAVIVRRVSERLQHFFQTSNDVLCFPGSGSAGWEASIANLFSPGDRVAAISVGNFGDRFATVATAFGLRVEKIAFEWGQAADPTVVADRLGGIADLRGVLLTHNETSTGVTNDAAALSRAIRGVVPDALIAVDAVSSLGCVSLPMDELGLDVVFTGSQKGWMIPPGLMMIAASPRALAAGESARLPRFFWDFARARATFAKGQPPYTAPVSLWYQLDVALALMMEEGREAIFARHAALGAFTRQRLAAMGLSLFADPAHASNTVTAVLAPAAVEVKSLLKTLREQENVFFASGQGAFERTILRIGHKGYVSESDIAAALAALERHI